MQQKQFIDLQISSTCFGQFFAHLQERKTVNYIMWYNGPRLCVRWDGCCSSNILHTEHIIRAPAIQASDRQQSGGIIPHAVIHRLTLLKTGKELPEKCWANLKINKLLLLHLVGPTLYFCRWCTVKHTANTNAFNLSCYSVGSCVFECQCYHPQGLFIHLRLHLLFVCLFNDSFTTL